MATMAFERPLTAQEAVLGELRRNILTGRWGPGTPIRQDAVAAELGVSRVPVREALKILEGEGQVTYAPHKGYIVREFDTEELLEVYRLREILEAEAVRAAMPHVTDDELAAMHTAMTAMEALDPEDITALTEQNRAFHLPLFECSQMPRLLHFIRLLRDWSDAYRALLYVDAHSIEQSVLEHRAIYEACVARDAEQAIEVLDRHRSHTVEKLRTMLTPDA